MTVHDVAVIGAGPAGLAAALTLAEGGVRVVVLERSESFRDTPGEHLGPAALPVLARLGWTPRAPGAVPLSAIVSHWRAGPPVRQEALFDPYGLGFAIERATLLSDLAARAGAAGAALRFGSTARGISGRPGDWRITCDSGDVTAGAIFDASGRARRVARALGAAAGAADDLICHHRVLAGADAGAVELVLEAVDQGWWYTLALPRPGRIAAGFVTDRMTGAVWESALGRAPATRARIGGLSECTRCTVPCGSPGEHLAGGAGWRGLGDAHAASDPLSGLGLARALSDGREAARVYLGLAPEPVPLPPRSAETATRRLLYAEAGARWPRASFWRARTDDKRRPLALRERP